MVVITDIGIDHVEILGPTLKDIAGEKAGIIKDSIPTVTGLLPAEAGRVIRTVCRQRGSLMAPLRKEDFTVDTPNGALDFEADGLSLQNVRPALHGKHQLTNTALVLKTIAQLRRRGFRIPKRAIEAGLRTVDWPGRFQIIRNGAGSPTVVLDVCHNDGGARAFAATFAGQFPGRRARFLLGLVKRKEHQAIVDSLSKVAELFWLVPMNTKRTIDVKQLADTLDWHGVSIRRSAGLGSGWRGLLKLCGPDDIIAIVGSHYLVGEYLSKYRS